MKILFLTQTYPRYPGDTAGPFIREIARALVRGGDRVTVLAPHAEGVPGVRDDDGVAVRHFRYAPVAWEVLGYSRSLEKDETVKPAAAGAAPFYALGALRAVRRAVRGAAEAGDPFDLVHAHWVIPNGPSAALALALERIAGRPVPALAVGLHGSDVFQAERTLLRPAARYALARAALLTGCSPELVDRVCEIGFPPEHSRVIPYGIDADTYRPLAEAGGAESDPLPSALHRRAAAWRRRLGIPATSPLVLSVGRMATKKGYHVLFDAFPRLLRDAPDAHWVLAGAGDLLADFRARAAALQDLHPDAPGLVGDPAQGDLPTLDGEPWPDRSGGGPDQDRPDRGRIHLPGIVERDTLPDLFRAADLFVLPAVHDPRGNVDGLPNVILEAMGTGLPVVASAISGIPLAVQHGETGLLVPEQRPGPLADALLALLGDPDLRRRMGRAGRRRAVAELTWDAITARYRAGYGEALERR